LRQFCFQIGDLQPGNSLTDRDPFPLVGRDLAEEAGDRSADLGAGRRAEQERPARAVFYREGRQHQHRRAHDQDQVAAPSATFPNHRLRLSPGKIPEQPRVLTDPSRTVQQPRAPSPSTRNRLRNPAIVSVRKTSEKTQATAPYPRKQPATRSAFGRSDPQSTHRKYPLNRSRARPPQVRHLQKIAQDVVAIELDERIGVEEHAEAAERDDEQAKSWGAVPGCVTLQANTPIDQSTRSQ